MKLKPCPFCGSNDVQIEEIESALGVRKSAGCMTETCQGYQSQVTFATHREAANAWNERQYHIKVLGAAVQMDWMQVVLNQGPPCFHVQEDERFCGRAERWHTDAPHRFVSLADLIRNISSV